MATTVFALDAVSGAPSYTGAMIRTALANFAGVATASRPLGARSGVRPGTQGSTAYLSGATNFTWNVAAHAGIVDAETSQTAGPYMYSTDGTDTGTVAAANATNPRTDILYVTINDTVQDASGLASGVIGYTAGTPAATPVQPATPARSMLLAVISVPTAGSANPSISWAASEFTANPAAEGYSSAGQNIASDGNWHAVTLDGNNVNNDGMWTSSANTKFTCATPGWYQVSGQITFAANATGVRLAAIGTDGNIANVLEGNTIASSSGVTTVPLPSRLVHLNIGDWVALYAQQSSGSTLALTTGNALTFLSVHRVSV